MEELTECIICNNESKIIASNIRQLEDCKVFYCPECDFAFLEEKYLKKDEKDFYNKIYPKKINPEHQGNSPEMILQRRVALSKEYLQPYGQKRVLEVGSANGQFLHLISDLCLSVQGCELNKEHCESARKEYGINSFNADVLDLGEDEKFDVIFMFQLLEHIPNPHQFLDKLYALLNDDGLLIIDVPNLNEPLYKLYKCKKIRESFFFKLQHPMTYSEQALRKIMGMHSFKHLYTKLIQNYSITNHLNWIYKSSGNNSFVEGMEVFFDSVEGEEYKRIWEQLDNNYKKFLVAEGLSDIVYSVYRKS